MKHFSISYHCTALHSLLVALLGLTGCMALTACGQHKTTPEPEKVQRKPAIDTLAHLVHKVNQCARLYTSEFQIHKIVRFSDEHSIEYCLLNRKHTISTRIGDRKIAIPIDVTLKAYIDFNQFDARHIERKGNQLIVTLPDPQIVATASRIDNQGIREYVDRLRSNFTDAEMTRLASQGTDSILSHIGQLGLIEQAEHSAAVTLMPLFTRMGYQDYNVTIRFRKKFSNADLIPMTRKQ